MYYIHT